MSSNSDLLNEIYEITETEITRYNAILKETDKTLPKNSYDITNNINILIKSILTKNIQDYTKIQNLLKQIKS